MMQASALAQSLGLRKSGLVYVGNCPSCGYQGSFTARDLDSTLLVYCHACRDQQAILDTLRAQGLWRAPNFDHIAAVPATRAPDTFKGRDNSAYATQLWIMAKGCAGSPVETYLRRRGITLSVPPSLRYLKRHRHTPSTTFWPVMVGAVVIEGSPPAFTGIHRTYIRPDGQGKTAFAPTKMTLGPVAGGAVRLAPAAPTLAVAEGIETALSVMQATGVPTWAALSAGNLKLLQLPPPDLVREILIFGDNDASGTGQQAARAAAERWALEGRQVRLVLPPMGIDFNNLLAGMGR